MNRVEDQIMGARLSAFASASETNKHWTFSGTVGSFLLLSYSYLIVLPLG